MKTKLQLTCLTRRALLAVLICSAPLLVNHWLDALSDDVVVVGMPDDL